MLALTTEQRFLQDTIAAAVRREFPPEQRMSRYDSEPGVDGSLWSALADIGVLALLASPDEPSAGGLFECALVSEELGRAAAPGGWLSHVLATQAIARGGGDDQRTRLLPDLIDGRRRAAMAVSEHESVLVHEWQLDLEEGRLRGEKSWVLLSEPVDVFVVGLRGGRIAVVERGPTTDVDVLSTIDRSRTYATVAFEGAECELLSATLTDDSIAQGVVDSACVLVAADAFGAAFQAVRDAASYAMERQQFGRRIAEFQAVKHQLADMALEVDMSRSLWHSAASEADPRRRSLLAAMSKAHITEVAAAVSRRSVEIFGGFGFTWECDIHRRVKRAIADRELFGSSAAHRRRELELLDW